MNGFDYEEEYQRDTQDARQIPSEPGLYDSLEGLSHKKAKRASSWLLTVIQVTVCGVVIVAALALKVFGGDLYTNIRDWYVKQINDSVVAEEQADSFKTKVLELFPRGLLPPPDASEPESSASGTESS